MPEVPLKRKALKRLINSYFREIKQNKGEKRRNSYALRPREEERAMQQGRSEQLA